MGEVQLGRWHGASGEEQNVGECFAYLTWLYGLFVRTLMLLTNAYTSCGRPTLNFIECFWSGSIPSASKLNSECIEMNWIFLTVHKMYRNVLQCTPNGPSTLASASLVIFLSLCFSLPFLLSDKIASFQYSLSNSFICLQLMYLFILSKNSLCIRNSPLPPRLTVRTPL